MPTAPTIHSAGLVSLSSMSQPTITAKTSTSNFTQQIMTATDQSSSTGKNISTTLPTISNHIPSPSFSPSITTPQTKTSTVHNSSDTLTTAATIMSSSSSILPTPTVIVQNTRTYTNPSTTLNFFPTSTYTQEVTKTVQRPTTRKSISTTLPAISTGTPSARFSTGISNNVTSISLTPMTTTFSTSPSKTSPTFTTLKTTTYTPTPLCICYWSDWNDFGQSTTGVNGGKVMPMSTLSTICSAPKEVKCRAKLYPGVPLSQLGQVVKCNVKDGLVCLNKDQGLIQQCFDYEIRVFCCDSKCGNFSTKYTTPTAFWISSTSLPIPSTSLPIPSTKTTTVQSSSTYTSITTISVTSTASSLTISPTSITPDSITLTPTPGCICSWSEWSNFGGPTTGPDGGEIVHIKQITDTYSPICTSLKDVECRAKLYPGVPFSQLGQVVKCNVKDGLVCFNKNQGLEQQCLDYEIRVLCCVGNHSSITTQCPTATMVSSGTTSVSPNTIKTSERFSASTITSIISIPTLSTIMPTLPSTTQTAPNLPSGTSIYTTPMISKSLSTASTTSPLSKTATLTTKPGCMCRWSEWLDLGGPTTGPEGGETVSIKTVLDSYPTICSVPKEVECRAKNYPRLSLSQLNQVVKCNAKDGLVCLNKNQDITHQCFDYEIRLFCCDENCGSTLALTPKIPLLTPTLGCKCHWSDWMDFSSVTTGPEGGEIISIKRITDTFSSICSAPKELECRAKLYPKLSLSQLGQVVICNAKDGLVCLNKNQDITQQCFDYEIRVFCCDGICGSTTALTPKIPLPTPALGCKCHLSDWMDFGSLTTGPEGGEIISIKRITDSYPSICSAPKELECRSKLYPELSLSQLGQVVICNAKDGLMCLNKNQDITQQCFDYDIRVLCCHGKCDNSTEAPTTIPKLSASTTTSNTPSETSRPSNTSKPTRPTSPCICHWSKWLDFGGPTIGQEGGKLIPVKIITNTYPTTCSIPQGIECRAKNYPGLPVSKLGQEVKCNLKDGLVCLNKKQNITQQCFDYEMRLLCCHRDCVSASLPAALNLALHNSSTRVSTTAVPTTRAMTTTILNKKPSKCICQWSKWVDFGSPTEGPEGGKLIPVKIITDFFPTTCSIPHGIECRAKHYPGLPVSKLGQVVKCNLKDGLVCLNKNQNITQQCFDYEMRLLCCHRDCVGASLPAALNRALHNSSTRVSTTTVPTTRDMTKTLSKIIPSKCICQWSDWMDFGSPTTGPEGGEIVPIKTITNTFVNTCSAPTEVECHAKLFPGLLLSQLGQVVTCNTKDGLVCLNKNQGVTQQCFDYEIKVLCCHGLCGVSSKISQTDQYFSHSTIRSVFFPQHNYYHTKSANYHRFIKRSQNCTSRLCL